MTERSPWVFRYRIWLFALIISGSFLLGRALEDTMPFSSWYGVLSLPREATFAGHLPVTGRYVWMLIAPIVVTSLGALVRAWGTSYLRGHVMTDSALHTDRLIVSGPFRYLRNPLYMGNLLIGAGYGLIFPPPALPLCVSGMALLGAALARVESKAIAARHGADYEQYRKAVRAFIPGPLRASLPPGAAVKPEWGNGLGTECIHAFVALYFAFILTGYWALALLAVVAVMLLSIRRSYVNRKARQAEATHQS